MDLKQLSLLELRARYFLPDMLRAEKDRIVAELARRKSSATRERTKAKHTKPSPKGALVSKIYKGKGKLRGRPLSGGRIG